MPHIVLENINSTQKAYESITPFSERIEGGILKVSDKYINSSAQSALIESIVVEAGKNQTFFIQLSEKKTSLTVRLLPLTDPEKTPGVKTVMARIAKQIKDSDSSIFIWKNQS